MLTTRFVVLTLVAALLLPGASANFWRNFRNLFVKRKRNPWTNPWPMAGSESTKIISVAGCEQGTACALQCLDRNNQPLPSNYKITSIVLASYGTPSLDQNATELTALCNVDPTCHAPSSQDRVNQQCIGALSCSIPVNNEFFGGDPCPGTDKYLAVTYQCTRAVAAGETADEQPALGGYTTGYKQPDDGSSSSSGLLSYVVGGGAALLVVAVAVAAVVVMRRRKQASHDKSISHATHKLETQLARV